MSISRVRKFRLQVLTLLLVMVGVSFATLGYANGEPAEEFIKRLKAAKYFDTTIVYLDRLDQYPGVDPNLTSAIPLEKAQAYIGAAFASRNADARDEYFASAEAQLGEFLTKSSHPRLSEARLQLGWIQMVRAAQLLNGEPDDKKRQAARESYLAASKTFDTIVETLRAQLKEMQGAKIDATKNPEQAALRDQYRGEFLQAMVNAGEARRLAARTFADPGTEGKSLLEQALKTFTELSENYDSYVQGAAALVSLGQVQEDLGMDDQAMDSYMRMLESPDADPLRDAKFQATNGLIRLWLAESPPKFQAAIDRGQPLVDAVRPDERTLPSVQELRINVAKALLLKSKDKDNQKPAELKRAESEGRQLLIRASKIPGEYADQANQRLAELGIDLQAVPPLATAEDPTSLVDALEKSRDLYAAIENLTQSLAVLEKQENQSDEIKRQQAEIKKQLMETRANAIQILRRGLALVMTDSDIDIVNQTRQLLTYLLYQDKHYREAAVVGTFLAKNAPATEVGLKGGLLALNSFQLALMEDGDNPALIVHLEELGTYLIQTWPNDAEVASAQGVMIKLALRNDRWDDAREMVDDMPDGPQRPFFRRLMGQLLWNESVQSLQTGDTEQSEKFLQQAAAELRAGLDGITGNIVDPEGMTAALILTKIYLLQGDIDRAAEVLDHEIYGPTTLMEKQGAPDENFASDLYSTELKIVVQQMTSDDGDSQALLDRAIAVMEKLRASVTGPDAQQRLTRIFIEMAGEIRQQLGTATPGKKAKLIDAFRVFLDRISATTQDPATLTWVGNTLMDLAEASMNPNQIKAQGQAAELLNTAVETFERLKAKAEPEVPTQVSFQLGKAHRLLGNYKTSIDTLEGLLTKTPMMLDAQIEAALAYEQWAGSVKPKYAGRAYEVALNGGRPNAKQENVIWGWGRTSQLTQRDPKYKAKFFDARYHVALCRYLWGKRTKTKALIEKSAVDIKRVADLYPDLGGPEQRSKFDVLLKTIQKELGQQPVGLPPMPAGKS